MQVKHLIGGLVALGALTTPLAAQAQQFSTVAQVMSVCPDLSGASACPVAAATFIAGPNAPGDTEISTLALTLAQAGQFPRVPMPVCLDTAAGIRVLARGVASSATAAQLDNIADSLCLGVGTAAIPGVPVDADPSVSLTFVDPDDIPDLVPDTSDDDSNGGDTNGGDDNGGDDNGGNGGHGNGGHGNGGHGNGGHGNGGDDNGGHGNGGHDNGGDDNGGHGNGGHGNGGDDNGGHGNGGHGNGGDDNGGDDNGGHGNGGHDNGGDDNGGHGNGGHDNGGNPED